MLRTSTIILFIVYLLILIKLVVFKYPVDFSTTNTLLSLSNGNYLPFKTILGYLSGEPAWRIAIRNLAGNVLLFVPFGVFLPVIFRTITWKGVFITSLVFSVLLECMQVFYIGTPDIDDVILNVLGAMIGYGIFIQIKKIFKRRTNPQSTQQP